VESNFVKLSESREFRGFSVSKWVICHTHKILFELCGFCLPNCVPGSELHVDFQFSHLERDQGRSHYGKSSGWGFKLAFLLRLSVTIPDFRVSFFPPLVNCFDILGFLINTDPVSSTFHGNS
jgi:hypothetical protein